MGPHRRGGANFCAGCGQSLGIIRCPSCSEPVQSSQRFCAHCGTPLDGAAGGAAAATNTESGISSATGHRAGFPTGVGPTERRVCSVLFCDLVGFTSLTEEWDPEDVRDMLSRYFEAARVVINRYGGTLEKFIGDAVVAAWGIPIALEGEAERAVRAALDLVDAVADLAARPQVAALAVRVSVVTGEVAVTSGEHMTEA
ncbi:MAG: adenylate/guanylate cyclase domain-containing protein [Nocardioidaceae bacterium]